MSFIKYDDRFLSERLRDCLCDLRVQEIRIVEYHHISMLYLRGRGREGREGREWGVGRKPQGGEWGGEVMRRERGSGEMRRERWVRSGAYSVSGEEIRAPSLLRPKLLQIILREREGGRERESSM